MRSAWNRTFRTSATGSGHWSASLASPLPRELGIRVALGADRRAVVGLIVGEGLTLAAIGIAIGLAGSWLLTGSLRTMLFDVSPLDPAVIGLTCVAVLLVTIVASYVPARRALRVDPMSARCV
jgi:putative ABC transport system permease protein